MPPLILIIIEWLATAGSILGSFLVSFKRVRHAMRIWVVCNAIWIAIFLNRGLYAPATLFTVYLISAWIGAMNWKKE